MSVPFFYYDPAAVKWMGRTKRSPFCFKDKKSQWLNLIIRLIALFVVPVIFYKALSEFWLPSMPIVAGAIALVIAIFQLMKFYENFHEVIPHLSSDKSFEHRFDTFMIVGKHLIGLDHTRATSFELKNITRKDFICDPENPHRLIKTISDRNRKRLDGPAAELVGDKIIISQVENFEELKTFVCES